MLYTSTANATPSSKVVLHIAFSGRIAQSFFPRTHSSMYLRQASALAARRATAGSVRRLATGKDVKFGVEGRALMLQGVDMLADAVQVRELTDHKKSSAACLACCDVVGLACAVVAP